MIYANKFLKLNLHSWRKKTFIILLIIGVIVYYHKNEDPPDACHYIEEEDSLPLADDAMFISEHNAIFFHETSCRGGLVPRQACAIESAARAHPNRHINVLFSAPVSEFALKRSCHKKLLEFKNIRFARVHIEKYTKGTPLEVLVANRPFSKSMWWREHTSDILRYVTLYKYGGIYLDTDMYVVRDLTPLGRNWLATEDEYTVNGAAFAIAPDKVGRRLITAVLNLVNKTYNPNDFTYNGPYALYRVLEKLCNTDNTSAFSSETCNGVDIYNWEYIYPVHYSHCMDYFLPGELKDNAAFAYTHHLWNSRTEDIIVQHNSPFSKIALSFCPTISKIYNYEFGFQDWIGTPSAKRWDFFLEPR